MQGQEEREAQQAARNCLTLLRLNPVLATAALRARQVVIRAQRIGTMLAFAERH
jgi:hypothetical protein